jgi:SAM-dependent methyltransferase
MSDSLEQQSITAWFDTTYRRRGARYLRPIEAYQVFPELLDVGACDRLLDVACGPGVLLQAVGGRTRRLYGCDISTVAVGLARKRVPEADVLVANGEALPYESGTFDVVTCLGSLERMLDRPRALREMGRVGTERARYCFLVRNSDTGRWRYLSRAFARRPSRGHADAASVGNWTALFHSAGFKVLGVLPDQYPLLRRKLWRRLRLGAAHFRTVATSRAPLERANEFIFLLAKQ